MKLKPLSDQLIVRPNVVPTQTQSGIYIPETAVAAQHSQQGKIVAAGPGRMIESGAFIPMQVKEGDTVMFGKYGGITVSVEGEVLLVMKESDLLCIVEKS